MCKIINTLVFLYCNETNFNYLFKQKIKLCSSLFLYAFCQSIQQPKKIPKLMAKEEIFYYYFLAVIKHFPIIPRGPVFCLFIFSIISLPDLTKHENYFHQTNIYNLHN